MKKMLQNLRFLTVALGALLAVSCAKEPVDKVEKKFILPDVAEQYLPAEGVAEAEAIVIPVFATDNEWMILQEDESMEWLHVTTVMDAEGSKALSVTAEANEALESRETYLNIYYDTYSTSILFVQVAADEQDATSIECDSMVVVTKGFGDVEFDVTANGAYEVVIPSDVDWLSWDNGKFFFGNYFGEQPRVAEVVVRSEFAEAKVTFVQVGSLEFSVAKTDYTLTYKAGTLRIPVQTWLDEACAATTTVDWLRADAEATTKDTVVLVYDENSTEEPRSATVELSAGSTKVTVDIDQIAPKEYDAIVSDKQKSDLILKVAKAEASSQFSSSRGSMKNAYDGNDLSYWSTTATNQDGTVFISFEFAEDQEMTQIDYFRYCPSRSISWGNWGKVEVYTQFEGEEEKLFATYDFEMADTPRIVEFDEPLPANLRKATFKILTAKPYNEKTTNVASAAGVEFCQYNPENFPVKEFFTDASCSELLPSVTYDDIMAIRDPFYRSMAEQIFNGDWNKYRVCEVKAYPHPDVDAKIFFTPPHTLLDNVTGMYVAKVGEPIYLFVEEDYGQEMYLRVCDMVNDEGLAERVVGRCESDYRIYKGKNVIIPGYRGLMYIIWHTPDYAKFPPIKINFATGHVNGYFYLGRDKPEDFYRLLRMGGNTEPHFDMLSDKVIMNFPKETIYNRTLHRNGENSADGARLVAIFDSIVRQQERWQGHDKYSKIYAEACKTDPTKFRGHRNRAPFFTLYGNAVAGSGVYRTGYGINSILQDVTDPQKMWDPNTTALGGSGTTDADRRDLDADVRANNTIGTLWGVAHEIGHSNQCRPFAWRGLTEVTNNLMCVGTQVALFGEGHTTLHYKMKYNDAWRDFGIRYITDYDAEGNQFERRMTQAEAANSPAAGSTGGVDPAATLVPFWQLFLYYHFVEGNTDFYPDFFEQCRLRGDIFFDHGWDFRNWSGNQGLFDKSNREQSWAMTDYLIKISKAAGEDLSDWALRWGIPGENTNMRVSVYGQNIINTTKEMIAEAVKECSAFPKPKLDPYYISDSNLDLYRNPKAIVAGTHTIENKNGAVRVTTSGWQNVAAWVLYDPVKKRDVACFEGRFTAFSYKEYISKYVILPDGQTNPEGTRYQYNPDGYNRSIVNEGPFFRDDLLLYAVHPDGSRVASLSNPSQN